MTSVINFTLIQIPFLFWPSLHFSKSWWLHIIIDCPFPEVKAINMVDYMVVYLMIFSFFVHIWYVTLYHEISAFHERNCMHTWQGCQLPFPTCTTLILQVYTKFISNIFKVLNLKDMLNRHSGKQEIILANITLWVYRTYHNIMSIPYNPHVGVLTNPCNPNNQNIRLWVYIA